MDGMWTTRDGTELEIKNMETDHIKNCMSMLERNAIEGVEISMNLGYAPDNDYIEYDSDTVYGEKYLKGTEYYELKKELENRGIQ